MKKTLRIEAMQSLRIGELADLESRILAAESTLVDKRMASDEDEETGPATDYSVINGTAVYRINGPLISTGTWFSRYLGYVSYEDVRMNMMLAAQDPQAQDILMLVGSPGGSVYGVTDAADAIRKADKVKPVYAYSNKNMASGAYWLGAEARQIFGSPEAEFGSIGVIVTHFSYEKQMTDEGVKATIIRSSDLKAVGGPYKDLTDKEIAHIEESVMQYDNLFKAHVIQSRPTLKASAMSGATFIGEEARKLGLIDAVMSYDEVMQYIQNKRSTNTQAGGYSMKIHEIRTALDSGKTLEDIGVSQEEYDALVAEADAALGEGTGEAGTNTEVDAGDTPDPLVVATERLETLTTDLSAKDAQIVELTAALAAKDTEFEAASVEMKTIVCGIMSNRRLALNLQGEVDFSTFSVPTLLAEYRAVTEQYDKAFKTGGLFKGKAPEKEVPVTQATAADYSEDARMRGASIPQR